MTISSFYGNTVPAVTDVGSDNPVELGIKFHPTVAGWVTHIRFYKSIPNTGTHVVNLWDATQTVVATATATGEAASGWIDVPLVPAYAITSGQNLLASYHTDVGHYADDAHYFDSQVTSGQLVGPADSVNHNGTFAYGAAGANYPDTSFNASSYGVDLFFTDTDPSGTTGTVAATQAPNTASIAGAVLVAGAVAATQHPNTAAASGAVAVSGAVAATQARNTMSAAGTVVAGSVTGAVAATQAPNVAAISGAVGAISGAVAATQKPNVMHASGRVGTALAPTNGYTVRLQPRHWIVSISQASAG